MQIAAHMWRLAFFVALLLLMASMSSGDELGDNQKVNCVGGDCFGSFGLFQREFSYVDTRALKSMLNENCPIEIDVLGGSSEEFVSHLVTPRPTIILYKDPLNYRDLPVGIYDIIESAQGHANSRVQLTGGEEWQNPITGEKTKELWLIDLGFDPCGTINCITEKIVSISFVVTGLTCTGS